jgi:hypothetical protein
MEFKLKKAALITYGVFYLVLILIGFIESIASEKISAVNIIGLLVTSLYMLGYFAYAVNKKIWKAVIWRRLFYLASIGNFLKFLLATLFMSGIQSVGMLIDIFLSLPILYVLYKYSETDRVMWLSSEEIMKGKVINRLLLKEPILLVEKAKGEDKAIVTIFRESDFYSVKIIRAINGNEESFSKKFKNLGHLATYIEKYSIVQFSDIEAQYI